jgi:hypothetical protein
MPCNNQKTPEFYFRRLLISIRFCRSDLFCTGHWPSERRQALSARPTDASPLNEKQDDFASPKENTIFGVDKRMN